MINKLELNNFKCFQRQEVNFRDMTILTGINAAGKSSIVQALLLYERATEANEKEVLDASEVLGIDIGSPKNLVSQNCVGESIADFDITVNGSKLGFYIGKDSGLDLYAKGCGTQDIGKIAYLNAERIGPRMSYRAGGSERIRQDGSNAIYLMERADNLEMRIPEELILDKTYPKFSNQVECWMSLIMGNVVLKTSVDALKAQAELRISNEYTDDAVIPTLTGFGISYELSVVITGLWAATQKDSLLIVENPEAHLHPSAQSRIGQFLAAVAAAGTQVIVETHSEHVIDGARIQLYAMNQSNKFLTNFLFNREKECMIKELIIEQDGELSDWPEGFFDQKQQDLRTMFMLRRRNGNN